MNKLQDMGYETPDYGEPMVASDGDGKRKMKTVYPELHIRGETLPKLPEGEFYVVAKVKKVGYRDPADEGAKKECDLAVLSLAPVASQEAKRLASEPSEDPGDTEGRTPRRSLRESVAMAKDGASKDEY